MFDDYINIDRKLIASIQFLCPMIYMELINCVVGRDTEKWRYIRIDHSQNDSK